MSFALHEMVEYKGFHLINFPVITIPILPILTVELLYHYLSTMKDNIQSLLKAIRYNKSQVTEKR